MSFGNLHIDNLSGQEFEEYLLQLFINLGYDVVLTPPSNDYGADLVIEKNAEKIVVQAKRYSNTIGISAVQEVIGAKNYYEANKCLVVTNNYFTPSAIELAQSNDVELWDREKLIRMAVLSVNPKFNIDLNEDVQSYKNNDLYSIGNTDELLPDAIRLVTEEGMASISLIQRRLKTGYARAARLIDQMEEMGIISGYEGIKPREILVTAKDIDQHLNNSHDLVARKNLNTKDRIIKIAISFFILAIILSLTMPKIKNPFISFFLLIVSIFISYKLGFWIADKIFSKSSADGSDY